MTEEARNVFAQASKFALKNAEAWLMRAKQAKDSGPVGHSFSMAVTANEELAKAYISWMVSVGLFHPKHEFVLRTFDSHFVKHMFMIQTYLKDDLSIDLEIGVIDSDDLLREALKKTETEAKAEFDEYIQRVAEGSVEMEELRRDGIYVDIWDEDNDKYALSNPEDFSLTKRDAMLTLVEGGMYLIGMLLTMFQEIPEIEIKYVKYLKERLREKPWEWL